MQQGRCYSLHVQQKLEWRFAKFSTNRKAEHVNVFIMHYKNPNLSHHPFFSLDNYSLSGFFSLKLCIKVYLKKCQQDKDEFGFDDQHKKYKHSEQKILKTLLISF